MHEANCSSEASSYPRPLVLETLRIYYKEPSKVAPPEGTSCISLSSTAFCQKSEYKGDNWQDAGPGTTLAMAQLTQQ